LSVNTKTKPKKKTQKFVRLNLDSELESMLEEYEVKYKLLSRSDIIRMLLSEIYYQKTKASRKEFANFINSLPQAKHNLSEDEVYELIDKEL
jgi:hypothetical protein